MGRQSMSESVATVSGTSNSNFPVLSISDRVFDHRGEAIIKISLTEILIYQLLGLSKKFVR